MVLVDCIPLFMLSEENHNTYKEIKGHRSICYTVRNETKLLFFYVIEESAVGGVLAKSEQLHQLKHENHDLNTLIVKMKAMKTWRQNHESVNYLKLVGGH